MSTKRKSKSKAARKQTKQSKQSPSKKAKKVQKQPKTPQKSKAQTKKAVHVKVASAYPTKYALGYRHILLLLTIRILSALFNPISDCDETFNYWEPTAFLLKNYGFQTWEYAPQFALRSYSYLMPQYAFGSLLMAKLHVSGAILFYAIRIMLCILCSFCEYYFASSLSTYFDDESLAFLTFLFLSFSSGMFNCCAAYLPQQFVCCMLLLSFGSFYRKRRVFAILFMGICVIFGWPFIGLLAVPLAIECMIVLGIYSFIAYVLLFASFLCAVSLSIDYHFYGKLVLPQLNIFIYNLSFMQKNDDADDETSGQNLYGVDDWKYYAKNLLLNWNIIYILALLAPIATNWIPSIFSAAKKKKKKKKKKGNLFKNICCNKLFHCFAPFWIWMLFFMYMPHKEERFMFVIYPFIALNAAITMTQFRGMKMPQIESYQWIKWSLAYVKYVRIIIITLFIALCASRSLGQIIYYKASLDIWYKTGQYVADNKNKNNANINICVGKEWYRIPSTLFVSHVAKIKWIKSGFDGQLPAEYNATNNAKHPFNDANQMETSRFVDDVYASCEYIVDLWESNSVIQGYDVTKYKVIESVPFLDRQATKAIFRSFYIPVISNRNVVYANYKLLKRKEIEIEKE